MITYHIRPELHLHRHLGLYIAFGIRATCRGRLMFYVPDVFLKRHKAAAFATLCNREQPEWIHFRDILEDVI